MPRDVGEALLVVETLRWAARLVPLNPHGLQDVQMVESRDEDCIFELAPVVVGLAMQLIGPATLAVENAANPRPTVRISGAARTAAIRHKPVDRRLQGLHGDLFRLFGNTVIREPGAPRRKLETSTGRSWVMTHADRESEGSFVDAWWKVVSDLVRRLRRRPKPGLALVDLADPACVGEAQPVWLQSLRGYGKGICWCSQA